MTNLVHACNAGLASVLWQLNWRAVWLNELSSGISSLTSEDNKVKQGVGSQAVGTVHRCAARLSCCKEAWHQLVVHVTNHLGLPVRGDTTHVVVDCWQHWGWLLGDIHACKNLGSLGDTWKTLGQSLRRQVVQVQVDVVLVRSDTTALPHLKCHGTAHDIAGSQILGGRSIAGHEWLALAVAQDASLTTAALSEKAACRENSRRVELHKLKILHWQTGPGGHGTSITGAGVG
mmetsp:Transcript_45218/g.81333  ORF Transcript_45218/g.81333 Transcript_45218/m.81333 type:complete len:232 (+) Transcript_45218:556-1251(+)